MILHIPFLGLSIVSFDIPLERMTLISLCWGVVLDTPYGCQTLLTFPYQNLYLMAAFLSWGFL